MLNVLEWLLSAVGHIDPLLTPIPPDQSVEAFVLRFRNDTVLPYKKFTVMNLPEPTFAKFIEKLNLVASLLQEGKDRLASEIAIKGFKRDAVYACEYFNYLPAADVNIRLLDALDKFIPLYRATNVDKRPLAKAALESLFGTFCHCLLEIRHEPHDEETI